MEDFKFTSNGSFQRGEKNFVVRSRQLFVSNGLSVVVVDAPSDRQNPPYLGASVRSLNTSPTLRP